MELSGREPVPRWAYPAAGAMLVLALAAMVASRLGAPSNLCWDVAWTSAAAGASFGLTLAWRRAEPANRRRWGWWAVAAVCWLFGQVAWNAFGVLGFPASPNVADALWWAFALMVIASVIAPAEGRTLMGLIRGIESVALIAAAVSLCFAALWPEVVRSTLPVAGRASALVYPLLYVSATVLLIQAMVGGALRGLSNRALQLVLSGIALQAVAFILWSYQLLEQDYVPGRTLLDPLWVFGLAAIALGGMQAARHPEAAAQPAEASDRGGLLPAALLAMLLAGLLAARVGRGSAGTAVALEAGLISCGGALVARASLLARRMRGLLARERAARTRLADREVELARLNEQLVQDSRRDPLTGISNRRALADDLPMLETVRRELGETFAFALCDIDHFKAYNDSLGHLAGDQALRMIAAIIRGSLRAGDAAYRFGGEELLLVLRDASLEEAWEAAERVRAAVERAALPHPASPEGVITVSIGVAAGELAPGDLLALSDAAVYQAKRHGRNCVVAATDPETLPVSARHLPTAAEDPAPRHLRGMLAISRLAASGAGQMELLTTLGEVIHTELSFQVVAVNLMDDTGATLQVVHVHGDPEARETLLGSSSPTAEWLHVMEMGKEIAGAIWLEAGSYEWNSDSPTWVPPTVAGFNDDAWDPDDMLLLPMRSAAGDLLGVVSVDQPLLGLRPQESELRVLMAVVDHAALMLEQSRRDDGVVRTQSSELRLAAVMLLAETLDLRDPSTARHAWTVGEYARRTAIALGLAEDRIARIHAAGVLHDLGKLGIADAILHKPGALDEREWREMKRHPEIGAQILEHAGMHDIAAWVRAHHERIDGQGYPAGLHAGAISLESRILAVADAYEAMVADRPYRRGMPVAAAREELLRCTGTQFDPVVIDAFLSMLGEEPLQAERAVAA